jgi:hypothetical protein
MKVFVFLAVLGVCYSISYKCKVGDTFATISATLKDCTDVDAIEKATCSMPAYIDPASDNTEAYGCGTLCTKELMDAKKCTTCTNKKDSGAETANTPCNDKEMAKLHAYQCPQFEKKQGADAYTEKTVKAECTTALVAEVKDSEKCFKPKADYAKPSGAGDDTTLLEGGCGTCADKVTDAKLKALCEDYTAGSGAATMSFLLAPLLAVLFWLH